MKKERGARLTDVQKTILQQIAMSNPRFVQDYNVRAILNDVPSAEPGYGVRLHTHMRGNRIINIDIVYNPGSDLYEVTAYHLRNFGLERTEIMHKSEVYCSDLDAVIRDALRKTNRKGGAQ